MAQRSKLLGRDGVKKMCVVCLVGASMSSFEGSLAWMLYWSNVLFLLDTLKPCYLQTLSIIKASAKSPVLQKSPCWRSKHALCKSPCWRSKHCFVSRPVVGEAKNCFTTDYTPSSCPAQRRRYSKVWHPKEMTPHSRRSQSLKTKQGSNAREKRNHNHKHSKAL